MKLTERTHQTTVTWLLLLNAGHDTQKEYLNTSRLIQYQSKHKIQTFAPPNISCNLLEASLKPKYTIQTDTGSKSSVKSY